jgi:Activator of Hsp90 ATPase homolog 1-like protein
MESLVFTTSINAPVKKVWDTMLHPVTYKEWVSAAWPDSYFEGTWKEGENLRFITPDGSGTLANLTNHKPYKLSYAKHIAVLGKGGVIDTESDVAEGWIGTTERYDFTEKDGQTLLEITITTNPQWAVMFKSDWPKALKKLKEICER